MKAKKLSAVGALERFATTARADLRFAIILGTAETRSPRSSPGPPSTTGTTRWRSTCGL